MAREKQVPLARHRREHVKRAAVSHGSGGNGKKIAAENSESSVKLFLLLTSRKLRFYAHPQRCTVRTRTHMDECACIRKRQRYPVLEGKEKEKGKKRINKPERRNWERRERERERGGSRTA